MSVQLGLAWSASLRGWGEAWTNGRHPTDLLLRAGIQQQLYFFPQDLFFLQDSRCREEKCKAFTEKKKIVLLKAAAVRNPEVFFQLPNSSTPCRDNLCKSPLLPGKAGAYPQYAGNVGYDKGLRMDGPHRFLISTQGHMPF